MENNESVVAAVIRELQDYVIVRKCDYANMLCSYKKYMMSKLEIENKLRAKLEAEYAEQLRMNYEHTVEHLNRRILIYQEREKVLEEQIELLKKKNLKWWQKIF